MRRITYRIGQFGQAVCASYRPLSQSDWIEVRRWLPEPAITLFEKMPRSDQRHSLRVLRVVQEDGSSEPALMQAALLHDCAKRIDGIRLWHRVALVLFKVSRSSWLEQVQSANPRSLNAWSRPFWTLTHHAELGADMAAIAGCLPQAVNLIRWHQADATLETHREYASILRRLQMADNAS